MDQRQTNVCFGYAPANSANVERFGRFIEAYARSARGNGLQLAYERNGSGVAYVSAAGEPEQVEQFQAAARKKITELFA